MNRWLAPVLVALAASAAACAGNTDDGSDALDDYGSESAHPGQFANPLLRHADGSHEECPDPNVTKWGANYFMVCTSPQIGRPKEAFPYHISSDLVHWRALGHLFSPAAHPAWAKAPGSDGAMYWAPEINRIDGELHIVFAATMLDGSMAIGAARAKTLEGPWTFSRTPLVAPGDGSIDGPGDRNSGRIDPTIVAWEGSRYLFYVYQPEHVHVARLADDGLSVVRGTDHELRLTDGESFHATLPWEKDQQGHGVVEGVEAHVKDGKVYLLYSGASTWDGSYAVGVARADSPLGPFEKLGAPILRAGTRLLGPGHSSQWIEAPNAKTYLLYHVQQRGHLGHAGPRLLSLDEVTFDAQGWPRVGKNGRPTEGLQPIP